MRLTFWGASRQVTGSMFLLELQDGFKVLVDCGIDFNYSTEKIDPIFPCQPSEINLVLLTHAHLDHSGNIPVLVANGYKGQILCTPPTFSLTSLLLKDCASINQSKLNFKSSKKHPSRRQLALGESFYLEKHAEDSIERFVTIAFNKKFEINKNLSVTFFPAGHLLGAASIILEVKEGNEIKTIAFSGDLGRQDYPLLVDPQPLPEVDYLVCESTYGGRKHISENNPEDEISEVITTACVKQTGRLIIPAFSIGRTQTLLYILNKLYLQNKLPKIKVFSDSPMAEESTRIYERHVPVLNKEAQSIYSEHKSLFDFKNLIRITNYQESKAISSHTEPCIIISSSGMLTGGRMMHHIKKNVNNPYCTILVIGYAAEGTPGHDLTSGKNSIKIKGKSLPIAARIVSTDVFSGHADQDDLIRFVKQQSPQKLKKLFLVHGEYESMQELKKELEKENFNQVELPFKKQSFEL